MPKTIVLTAGHSNVDPGAVSRNITEADTVTELRNILASKLRKLGHLVITDGEGDTNLPLNQAAALIAKGDVAIELHCNASSNLSAKGVETISLPKDKKLAQQLSGAIHDVTGSPLRGELGWIDQSKSARGRLRFVEAGGLIVELTFISNPQDLQAYYDKRWVVATALADVIHNF